MENIIPFKKDVIFKTNLSEITSISLENTLNLSDNKVSGDFIISGEYKVSDKSTTVEPFDITIPFEIVVDDRYCTKKATVDIDDFYYEIVNNNVLSISIDVLIDKLEEKPLIELEDLVEVEPVREIINVCEEKKVEEQVKPIKEEERDVPINEAKEKIDSLFSQFSKDNEVYIAYNVYIIRDGDTLESVLEKYSVSLEELKKYNDVSNIQIGDKLIIPNINERD